MDATQLELIWSGHANAALAIVGGLCVLAFWGLLLKLHLQKRRAPSWPLPLESRGPWSEAADAAVAAMEAA